MPLYARTLELIEMQDYDVDTRRIRTADALKSWVRDDLAPDLGASFAADLLGYAFDLVDWYEIADSWIKDSTEAL